VTPSGTSKQSTATRICQGHTAKGTRCRRKAAPGGFYCTQHAAQATEEAAAASANGSARAKPGSVRAKQGAAQPRATASASDFDRGAFDEVKSDLGDGDFDERVREGSSPMDDLAGFAEFAMENLGRVKDAAVNNGVLDASRIERLVADVANAMISAMSAFAERASGDYEEDDFGFDENFTNGLVPLIGLLYDYYWRVDVDGVGNVPADGRALLVSNHAGGGLPFDGAMIKMAILREHPQPRHARMMALDWVMGLPWMADMMKKTGQVLACTPNALELLERDEIVGVFPEGVKGMAKPFSQRYNLERFGRGGFVRIALRTGAPIIPVAVVGSEEIYPKIGNMPVVNKLIGAPFVPITPLFPLFGLAGLIPLPSKWHIEFCDPIDVSDYPPEAADDRTFVLELSERIRATIQERLRANLLKRQTPFW
jgi:1-acyl-sn-glycerol-3-phosphate acyltransferase